MPEDVTGDSREASGSAKGDPGAAALRTLVSLLLESVRDPLFVLDESGIVRHVNAACCRWIHLEPDDFLNRPLFEIGGGFFDVPALRALIEQDLRSNTEVRDLEIAHSIPGRKPLTLVVNARAAEGMVVISIADVTEERSRARELATSTQQFQLLMENVREYAIFAMDVESRITVWNPGAERILGWSEEEVLGESGSIVFMEDDRRSGVPEHEMTVARNEGQALDERWHVRKDGTRFWASGVMIALREGGHLRGFVKILRDNTRRKRAESEIEASHRWLARILEVTPDVVALYDLDEDRVGFVSPRLISNLGYAEADFYSLNREAIGRIIHPDDRLQAAEIRQALRGPGETDVRELSVRVYDAEGAMRWYHARVVPFSHNAEGNVREVLVVARDFTEMHETEEQLRRLTETLEKRVEERTVQVRALASILTMAEQQERRRISQILHDDLQQRLYGIQMKMAAVRRGLESGAPDRAIRDATEAEKWLRDTIDLTRELTVELSPPVLKGEGLVEALHWLVAQMERMYGLSVDIDASHSFVIADEDMRVLLFQIVRELLFNVVKHAGVDRANVALRQEEDHLVIRVSDRGRGFDREAAAERSHAEQPFGLFSVQERLQLFGGHVTIDTAPGAGTTIEVHAPSVLAARLPERGRRRGTHGPPPSDE